MVDIPFPRRVRWTSIGPPVLEGQSLQIERSINGTETIIPTLTGHWRIDVSCVMVGEDAELEWEGFLAQMQGRIGTTLVPILARYRVPLASGVPMPLPEVEYFESAEHWVFASEERAGASLAADAAVRATDLSLTLTDSERPRPGHRISIAGNLHRVALAWDDSGPKIRVQPPVRQAFSTGQRIETDRPVCRMRMASETSGETVYDLMPVRFAQASFVEAI